MRHVSRGWWFNAVVEAVRITDPLLERCLRADQRPPFGGVRFRQQTGNRHGGKCRVAVKRIAVRVGELDRFVYLMDVFGSVVAGGFEINTFADVQRLQQARALIPGSGLVDVESVKRTGGR